MARVFLVATMFLGAQALAAPSQPASSRYEGVRLAFTVPVGMKVADATDISADYALDLVPQPGSPLVNVTVRLLLSDKAVTDADSLGKTWRSARVRNRASWGVHKNAETRSDTVQLAGRRFVRYVDEMGSRLGPAHQIMLCGLLQGHLLCGVANAPVAEEANAERVLEQVLESINLRAR
jgi:hypothetical protein